MICHVVTIGASIPDRGCSVLTQQSIARTKFLTACAETFQARLIGSVGLGISTIPLWYTLIINTSVKS